jgi:hydrogenase-4 component F
MISMELLVAAMFLLLAAGIAASMLKNAPIAILKIPAVSSALIAAVTVALGLSFFHSGARVFLGNNFLVDSLALYHIVLVNLIFFLASMYAPGYFLHRHEKGELTEAYARRFTMLWQTFQALLLLVLLSNNIGFMWIAVEATTLVSAFLIISDSDALSIEAMWKYLLICSIGIAFAFMGTIMTVSAARNMQASDTGYLFSQLIAHPNLIDPKLMLFAFIFITVGFGTKAGLSPMHTWLPDAHSQAPTPVSAVFSGVMLNCALFCIMRYLPITEAAMGHDGQAHSIVLLFGFMSLIFAAVFIPIQTDMKRLLAYCSVEHIGIIAIGLGLGGLGTFAALLHVANHSVSKVLAFFSAGHIGEKYGTRDMGRITAAARRMPWWGGAFFISMLVLIGVAPFCIFISEFLIVKEAFFSHRYLIFGLFLFAALAIFISILKQTLGVSFGIEPTDSAPVQKVRMIDKFIIVLCIAALFLLGLWIPSPFAEFLRNSAEVIENGIRL